MTQQAATSINAKSRRVLIAERKRRHLTQLQAAVAIGISPVTLARAEAGDAVQPKTVDQIAAFYELDAHELAS